MGQPSYKPSYDSSWAIVVGIDQYRFASPLSYAGNDATSLSTILTKKLGFPKGQVIVLQNTEAIKEAILREFIALHTKVHPDDRVLFFFAGHGYTVQGNKGPIGYLVPVDGDVKNLSSLIRWDDITRNAELIQAKHIFFVMDACYSGLALRRVITPGVKRFLTDMLQRPSRQVITAGKADQTVADGGGDSGRNSIFTGHLLEGLNGAAANAEGVLTAGSLMPWVCQKVGQHPSSSQTPHYGHIEGDGDFVFLTPGQEHLTPQLSTNYLIEANQEMDEVEELSSAQPFGKPSFALQRGYGDKNSPNFGRNDLSTKLGEYRIGATARECERAFSWLSVLIEPIANQEVSIDIAKKAAQPNNIYSPGTEPHERFSFPQNLRTTSDSLLLSSDLHDTPYWGRYLKIERSGNMEYADAKRVFFEYKGFRIFKFTQSMGLTWQLLFLAKSLLMECGYRSGIRLTFCLVGTRDTILTNFSQEAGQGNSKWHDPLVDPFGFSHISESTKCTDQNLKVCHDLVIGRINYEETLKVIKSISQNVELAYNHQEAPRCFNVDTDIFPWNGYLSDQRF
jgi:hypothetical protein